MADACSTRSRFPSPARVAIRSPPCFKALRFASIQTTRRMNSTRGAVALQAWVIALGDYSVRGKSARCEHGQNIGLGEKGENGVWLDLADGASEPHRAPSLPDHGEHRAGRLEAEGEHTRVQVGFDVSSEQAGCFMGSPLPIFSGAICSSSSSAIWRRICCCDR